MQWICIGACGASGDSVTTRDDPVDNLRHEIDVGSLSRPLQRARSG